MDQEKVIVIDFGGQYNQLVARRVRECNVYCEIYSYKTDLAQIKAMNPKGIILTGGPNSCYEDGAPTCTKELFELGVPVLGLCYGAQLMQHVLGGKVEKAPPERASKTLPLPTFSRISLIVFSTNASIFHVPAHPHTQEGTKMLHNLLADFLNCILNKCIHLPC